MKRLAGIMVALAVVALLGAACGDDDEDLGDDAEATPTNSPRPEPVSLDLTADDYSFSPALIELEVGESLDISMANVGSLAHTFTLDDMLVDTEVAAGDEGEFPLTASEPGEFTFYCKYHRDQGMTGTLRVGLPAAEPEATESADSGGSGYGY